MSKYTITEVTPVARVIRRNYSREGAIETVAGITHQWPATIEDAFSFFSADTTSMIIPGDEEQGGRAVSVDATSGPSGVEIEELS